MTEIRNVRVLPRESFTTIRNTAVRDKQLSFRARGLLAWILSHQSGRLITMENMVAAGPDGLASIRTTLRELEKARYISRSRHRNKEGQWFHEMTLTDDPAKHTEEA